MTAQPTPNKHGGYRWHKSPELRRVKIAVTLDPKTIATLAPYTKNGERGRVIDEAVAHWIETQKEE